MQAHSRMPRGEAAYAQGGKIMNLIREMLSYPFLVRALAGGMMVSLCASLLGVSLVLRRYSMIGDGLSHVSFGALSIAWISRHTNWVVPRDFVPWLICQGTFFISYPILKK